MSLATATQNNQIKIITQLNNDMHNTKKKQQ